jgi:hypothetical protein
VLAVILVGMADAANYMYEKASVKGVGYKNAEMIVSTKEGFNGSKLVEKEAGSGNVITEKTELEAEKQIGSGCGGSDLVEEAIWKNSPEPNWPPDTGSTGDYGPWGPPIYWNFPPPDSDYHMKFRYRQWPTGFGPMDYINFTKQSEFEYMPVSYQTGTYDQKWMDKLCVQNYAIGAVLTEMYTHAEHLQKATEIKTRSDRNDNVSFMLSASSETNQIYHEFSDRYPPYPCCTGVLEANINSNVIGVAHIGWISRDPQTNSKGHHNEWGRSVEDLTGVFSIEKFIQLWGNSTCGAISVDWLPCV